MELEKKILGMMIYDNETIPQVAEIVNSNCFVNELNCEIYEAILKLHSEKKQITNELLYIALRKEPKYLAELSSDIYSSANIELYCAELYNKYQAKLGLQSIKELGNELQEGVNVYGAWQKIKNKANDVLIEFDSISKTKKHLFENLEKVVNDADERRKGVEGEGLRLKTLPTMNRLIGGIMPTDLIGIYGKEKSTKTSLAFEILLDIGADQRKPVIIFSYEMGEEELSWKALSMRTGIPFNKLRNPQGENKGGYLTDSELQKLKQVSVDKFKHTKIFIYDRILNEIQIQAKVESMIRKYGIKLIVIDYLMLMNSSRDFSSRREELNYLSRFFKQMSQQLRVPIILISQANESGERVAEMKGLERDSNYFFYVAKGEVNKSQKIVDGLTGIENNYTFQEEDYIITLRGIRHAKGNRSFICKFSNNRYVEVNTSRLPI
jgi:replicative DNA helicase